MRRVSARYDRRMPSCWLTTGGLTNRKNFSPRGAPLSDTSSNGCSTSASASSRGLAIVADEQMNDRIATRSARQIRRSRRSTFVRWLPNTPR